MEQHIEPPKIQKEEAPTTSNGSEEGSFKELENNNRHKTKMWTENWLRWTISVVWCLALILCGIATICLAYLIIEYTCYIASANETLVDFMGLAWRTASSIAVGGFIPTIILLLRRQGVS